MHIYCSCACVCISKKYTHSHTHVHTVSECQGDYYYHIMSFMLQMSGGGVFINLPCQTKRSSKRSCKTFCLIQKTRTVGLFCESLLMHTPVLLNIKDHISISQRSWNWYLTQHPMPPAVAKPSILVSKDYLMSNAVLPTTGSFKDCN